MDIKKLNSEICDIISNLKGEVKETLNSYDLDPEVSSCLADLSAINISALDSIRSAVIDCLSDK